VGPDCAPGGRADRAQGPCDSRVTAM
jgi:hypothetical protein